MGIHELQILKSYVDSILHDIELRCVPDVTLRRRVCKRGIIRNVANQPWFELEQVRKKSKFRKKFVEQFRTIPHTCS